MCNSRRRVECRLICRGYNTCHCFERLPNTEGEDVRGWMRRYRINHTSTIMKRSTSEDEVYHRMLSTDERVEFMVWCTVLFFEHLDCNKRLQNKRERGRRFRDRETSHHHHNIITHIAHHFSCFNALSNHQNTSSRDHIRCKEKSVVNHDGYPPSWTIH